MNAGLVVLFTVLWLFSSAGLYSVSYVLYRDRNVGGAVLCLIAGFLIYSGGLLYLVFGMR